MSKRRIVVTIDAGAKTCGRCRGLQTMASSSTDSSTVYMAYMCDWYGVTLAEDKRCPACLATEKEAKK